MSGWVKASPIFLTVKVIPLDSNHWQSMFLAIHGKSQISDFSGVNYFALKAEPLKLELWSDRKHHNLNSTYTKPHDFQCQLPNLQLGKSPLKIAEPRSDSLNIKPDVDFKLHVTSPATHNSNHNTSSMTINSPRPFLHLTTRKVLHCSFLKILKWIRRKKTYTSSFEYN